jgi:twitching motility protein PilT
VHESKKCLVNQREVGPHTLSFNNALRSALREDPDAILVGEMRDLETSAWRSPRPKRATSCSAAHLGAARTIDRIVDVFPAEKDMVRDAPVAGSRDLADAVQLKDGSGRTRARDHAGHLGHQNLITGARSQISAPVQTGNSMGMQTLDQCLTDLVRRNVVSRRSSQQGEVPRELPRVDLRRPSPPRPNTT